MPAARYAREKNQRYRLEGARCVPCGKLAFPPRQVCAHCRASTFVPVRFSGEGTVVTWTAIHVAPEPYAMQAPYVVAIIELDEGVRLTAQIADATPAEVDTGSRVRHVFRRMRGEGEGGILQYGYKFVVTQR
jgi:uncharacterized OB-fold protein